MNSISTIIFKQRLSRRKDVSCLPSVFEIEFGKWGREMDVVDAYGDGESGSLRVMLDNVGFSCCECIFRLETLGQSLDF
jgi:hypothetical protein